MTETLHFFPTYEVNSKTSLVLGCITPVREFKDIAIFEDEEGRMYRVRAELTAEYNGVDLTDVREGKVKEIPFDPKVPEKFIALDYYVKKKQDIRDKHDVFSSSRERHSPKVKTKLLPGEKGTIPREGDRILLQRLHQTAHDPEDRNYIEAEILEVWPSTVTLENEKFGVLATFNNNLGMVRVQVKDHLKYSGSLIMQPAAKRARMSRIYGA